MAVEIVFADHGSEQFLAQVFLGKGRVKDLVFQGNRFTPGIEEPECSRASIGNDPGRRTDPELGKAINNIGLSAEPRFAVLEQGTVRFRGIIGQFDPDPVLTRVLQEIVKPRPVLGPNAYSPGADGDDQEEELFHDNGISVRVNRLMVSGFGLN